MVPDNYYERNYGKIVGIIALAGIGAMAFFAGYVKGSPKSAKDVVGDLSATVKDTLVGAWEQNAGSITKPFAGGWVCWRRAM